MAYKVAVMPSKHHRTDLLKQAGMEVIEGPCSTTEEMISLLSQADGALINTQPLASREVLEVCPKLKVVSRLGVGVDSIDLKAATELGILACNAPGVNTTEVADHAVAMLLALTRRLYDSITTTRQGQWSENPRLTGEYQETVRRIAGHTVGIIGFGNIGRAFATRIRGFGPARILAADPYVGQTAADLYGVQMVDLDTLLRESDYMTVHASLTSESRHILDAAAFSKMKPTALVVNCARGPLVDEVALQVALKSGQIEAAAIDVTEVEPVDPESPLLSIPNLVITPHTAGYSPKFLEECPILQAESVINVLTGKKPHGLANPEVIKSIAVMRATNPGRWEGVPDFSTALQV
jgi:D-3-phosphoglycerate dehydrogenase